ncbi:MAG: endonuclease domain-containing protein [Clostridia bacterium]|nr:endonuclease domain-containing protein [Clostridia bacterium]
MELQYKHNKKIVPHAKELRKNMTKEERHLWYDYLRSYPVKVLRQKIIGNYIVDFCCSSAKLVIELDGSQHYDEEMEKDQKRTEFLEKYGLEIIRIPNNELNRNFNGVCEYIDMKIQSRLK